MYDTACAAHCEQMAEKWGVFCLYSNVTFNFLIHLSLHGFFFSLLHRSSKIVFSPVLPVKYVTELMIKQIYPKDKAAEELFY